MSTVLFGATSADQVRENIKALLYVNRLNHTVLARLDGIFSKPDPEYDWTQYKKSKK